MFSTLGQNSLFYILDKNNKPVLKIGKVTEAKINPQFYGLTNQEMDIKVDVNGEIYEFKKIPTNMSILSPSAGIVISDNAEDMTREFEGTVKTSKQALESIDYHKAVIESQDEIFAKLNPKYAKEKEQENKLNNLESRVGNMEHGINDIKAMLSQMMNVKQGGQ